MLRLYIKRQLRNMGQRQSIEEVSQVYANTSAPHLKKALYSEIQVLRFFQSKKYQFYFHRRKVFSTEIDLIFLSPDNCVSFVEVKSLSNIDLLPYRLQARQLQRLQRAKLFFESMTALSTEVVLATVTNERINTFTIS